MKITAVRLYRYQLPFRQPLKLAGGTLTHRRGFLLEVQTREGASGWGEAAPFPGLNRETEAEVEASLRDVARRLPGWQSGIPTWRLRSTLPSLISSFWEQNPLSVPSVAFAVETALLQAMAQIRGIPPEQIYSPRPHKRVRINALLVGSREEMLQQAQQHLDEGYTVFKVKIGRGAWEEEREFLEELAHHLPPGGLLRLDANRAWHLEEGLIKTRQIAHLPIEYLEEPLKNPEDLLPFLESSPLPIALDESLLFRPLHHPGIRAYVIKPGVHGGLWYCLSLMRRARQQRIFPVISSPFYSEVGLWHLAKLAAAAPARIAQGLDTARFLATGVLEPPLPVHLPMIEISQLPSSFSGMNYENLTVLSGV